MSKMKDLLITLIEKGDHETLQAMGASPEWVNEARVVAMTKKRRKNEKKRKQRRTATFEQLQI